MRCVLLLITLFTSLCCYSQAGDFWNVDFTKADSIALSFAGRDLRHPDQLARELTQGMTSDVEKFRVIFRWITDNIDYNARLYQKIIKKEVTLKYKSKKHSAFTQRASKQVYRRMIRQKKTICSGYATLLEYMCQEAGLQCELVSGYARNYSYVETGRPNHAWNAVKLNTKWYLADATWASGYVHAGRFHKRFNESYFLTDPSLFISNHYPSDKSWTLLKERPSLSQFRQSPLKPTGFIENLVNHYYPEKGWVRIKVNEPFELRFTSNADNIHSSAEIHVTNSKTTQWENAECVLGQNGASEYVLTHKFKERGLYFVHVFINGEATFVYKVSVV